MTGAPQHPSLTPPLEVPPVAPPPRIGVVNAVGLLVVALVITGGLLALSLVMSLCGLGGVETQCDGPHRVGGLALVGAAVVFLGVPALVAHLRRDARWLLAPVLEAALVVGLVVANDVF